MVTNSQPALRVLPRPADTNAGGDIFGGWIMSQVDIAGQITASRRAQGRTVTVAVNSFEFHQPVLVGDLISCYTDIVRIGRTSLTVKVEVFAERGKKQPQQIKVTEAILTYVHIDNNRKPISVPES